MISHEIPWRKHMAGRSDLAECEGRECCGTQSCIEVPADPLGIRFSVGIGSWILYKRTYSIYIYINTMIWYDMIQYDMIWYIMIWYDMIWYNMIWYDMIQYDMIWYDMIQYDMIWYYCLYIHIIQVCLFENALYIIYICKSWANRLQVDTLRGKSNEAFLPNSDNPQLVLRGKLSHWDCLAKYVLHFVTIFDVYIAANK